MAKLRKTRAQKEAAAEKRSQVTYSFNPSIHVTTTNTNRMHGNVSATHVYVKKDLGKTIITSLILLAAQLLLFFSLQHHIVKIPGVSY